MCLLSAHQGRAADKGERILLLALGGTPAVMNTAFYLALDRLPLALVAAIEFVGTIGVALLIDVPSLFAAERPALTSDLFGLFWAVLNGTFFVLYIVLGHKISQGGASGGVERLSAAMTLAFLFIMPIGFLQALDAFGAPLLVLVGIGVDICSWVIPYVCDQMAMSRLPRTSFALLLALLPATVIGIIVLRQIPSAFDILGVLFVMLGIVIHKPSRQVA